MWGDILRLYLTVSVRLTFWIRDILFMQNAGGERVNINLDISNVLCSLDMPERLERCTCA